jgi:hypothetical protein
MGASDMFPDHHGVPQACVYLLRRCNLGL